jgi:hypothetical protein
MTKQQKVKIFTAYGAEAIDRMDEAVNEWLAREGVREIVSSQTNIAQDPPQEDYHGSVTVVLTIWYRS